MAKDCTYQPFPFQGPPKIYPNWAFWFENIYHLATLATKGFSSSEFPAESIFKVSVITIIGAIKRNGQFKRVAFSQSYIFEITFL
jgi:hypothetical protein